MLGAAQQPLLVLALPAASLDAAERWTAQHHVPAADAELQLNPQVQRFCAKWKPCSHYFRGLQLRYFTCEEQR